MLSGRLKCPRDAPDNLRGLPQVAVDQVAVQVHRHRRRCVPQHPLDHLGISAGHPAAVRHHDGVHLTPAADRRPTQRVQLSDKAIRIGRSPDNDLIVADLDLSRQHAELRKTGAGSYEIIDLGSHNGVFVNGKRVSQAVVTE